MYEADWSHRGVRPMSRNRVFDVPEEITRRRYTYNSFTFIIIHLGCKVSLSCSGLFSGVIVSLARGLYALGGGCLSVVPYLIGGLVYELRYGCIDRLCRRPLRL